MGRSTLISLVLLAACSDGGPSQPERPDGGQFCTAGSHTCPGGTRCVNSYCTPTCTGGTACPAGTFCGGPTFPDDVCAPVTPVTCNSPVACPVAHTCLLGRCLSLEVIGDGGQELCTTGVAQDKCAPDAVCYNIGGANNCIGLPSCGQDGGCPAGAISAACNLQPDGGHIIEGKAPICPLTQCAISTDCIPTALCAHAFSNVTFGTCQFGITNDACSSYADCASAAVCHFPDAGPGADAGDIPRCRCVINTPDAGVCAGH